MNPVTRGFHHVTMVARIPDRTVAFYRDLLGLTLLHRTSNVDDPDSEHLFFTAANGQPGTLLTFLQWSDVPAGRWGVGGIHHLALGVQSEDAQLKWKRWLTGHGVTVSGPYDRGWFKSIYFVDPDGQVLEIATAGPGYTIDEPIEALGTTVQMPRQEQLRGYRDEAAIAAHTYPRAVTEISDDMQLDGIHHITGMTNDVFAMNDFYAQALGLRLVKKSVNQDDPVTPHWFWASYDGRHVGAHSSLTMFGWPTSNYRARAGVGQMHHIAFRADSMAQLHSWHNHLHDMNVEVTPVLERQYYSSIFFRAPDGLMIEIATDSDA
ncbi:MAG TPA: VOC family protein [Longimicrobiales bacterium]